MSCKSFSIALGILFVVFAIFAPIANGASTTVVISEIYGGAGCGTASCATYSNDYIELHNISAVPVNITGWSVQYSPATGTGAFNVTPICPVGPCILQPGQYFLVAEAAGANFVTAIPTADATGSIAMSATAGRVALVSSTTPLTGAVTCATQLTGAVDYVGYGTTATCFEGSAPAPAPGTTTADVRAGGGCVDRDNNAIDFQALAPNPQNSSSPTAICTLTAASVSVSGRVLSAGGTGIRGARVTILGEDGRTRTVLSNAFGYYVFTSVESGRSYLLQASAKGFAFSPKSIAVTDQLSDADLISLY
ncbi:MAG TPA: lamin tail domain-containing protein [Pyrinomonadaceae bacterium]|nr:lamin tail domain-containing protein [Pyrinomonadaceae bacterium]